MSTWINGRRGGRCIDHRDRGLQYGDGVFETMRIRRGRIRLLEHHLDRLMSGCTRLGIAAPAVRELRRELGAAAEGRREGVLKLIVTRGVSRLRGYRPAGDERCTRILTRHPLPPGAISSEGTPVRVRVCATQIGLSPSLAGLKTLNRLESVLARGEWRDARIWEGLMQDVDENIVCGTMSNLFVRRGSNLLTPVLDRCGVAGVMRRWVMETAGEIGLRAAERSIRWRDVREADEVFMSNAVVGLKSVAVIERGRQRLRFLGSDAANALRARLDAL
jgi:4-amino-4-deoxychorismate lyase